MRIAALILGLLGVAGSGALGVKWTGDAKATKADMDTMRKINETLKDPGVADKIAHYDRLVNAAYGLIGGAALGVAGCVLVMMRKGLIAAGLFLVGFALPLVIAQDGKPAVFTFGLAVAALFSFFVKATPQPTRQTGGDVDEDDDRPRR